MPTSFWPQPLCPRREQPDFGVLLDDMESLSGQEIAMSRLMQPIVQADVAFIV